LRQGDHIADDENALTEEHGEESGKDSVFLELLLLEENQETLFAHEIAITHPIEFEVDEERDPLNDESSSVVGVGPLVEAFILNDLCLV